MRDGPIKSLQRSDTALLGGCNSICLFAVIVAAAVAVAVAVEIMQIERGDGLWWCGEKTEVEWDNGVLVTRGGCRHQAPNRERPAPPSIQASACVTLPVTQNRDG